MLKVAFPLRHKLPIPSHCPHSKWKHDLCAFCEWIGADVQLELRDRIDNPIRMQNQLQPRRMQLKIKTVQNLGLRSERDDRHIDCTHQRLVGHNFVVADGMPAKEK